MARVIWAGMDERTYRGAAACLAKDGFELHLTRDMIGALRLVFGSRPDAVIIDSQVADATSFELTRLLRAVASDLAIVMVSEATDSESIVKALDHGADDHITKPFGGTELVVRVRAAIRRALRARPEAQRSLIVRTGELVFDRDGRLVTKAGNVVRLTPIEFRLLSALAAHVGRVASHRVLVSNVWGDEFTDETHYLRIYIGYLRKKIESDPSHPEYLLNEWGTGYRLASLPPVGVREAREASGATSASGIAGAESRLRRRVPVGESTREPGLGPRPPTVNHVGRSDRGNGGGA